MTYEEVRAKLAEMYGWTFSTIDDMSFEQIESAWRGGKPDTGFPVRSLDDVQNIRRNWRKYVGI
jgi:hypothetical protein